MRALAVLGILESEYAVETPPKPSPGTAKTQRQRKTRLGLGLHFRL